LHQGRFEQAASLAEKALKHDPRSTAARIVLAQANLAQGRFLPAYQQLREALRIDAKNVDALYYLGQLCNLLSQVEYQALYALAPDSARVHQLQAELYQLQENKAKAEEEYQAGLKSNPRSLEVLVALADLNRSQSRYDEALYVTSGASWAGWDSRRGAQIIVGNRRLAQRLRLALQASMEDVSTEVEQSEILRAITHPEDHDSWYEAWQIINDLAQLLPAGFYDLINMRYDKDDDPFDPSLRGGVLEGFWREDLRIFGIDLADNMNAWGEIGGGIVHGCGS
jgi:tetratricopeptide (TPR) repeat protein